MLPGLSTYVFLPQHLHGGLLDVLQRAGARHIEIFAARHHFDYTNRAGLQEIRSWFDGHDVRASLHAPVTVEDGWSRHVAPTLSLLDPEKSRRIAAMDETKRALESAERIPFTSAVLHLGLRDDAWDLRALEHAITAIEHLKAFATPLGVQLLLENTQNDVTTPEHLLEILRVGHFDDVGVCLDVGHAHLTDYKDPGAGIDAAFLLLGERTAAVHVHDNNGSRDEHLWPGEPVTGIAWEKVYGQLAELDSAVPGILEISYEQSGGTNEIVARAGAFFAAQRRAAEMRAEAAETPRDDEDDGS